MLGNVPVFFADSYASWQKGAIENENKLIRQYIPKGTDFENVTPLFIKKIQAKLNNRPLDSRTKCKKVVVKNMKTLGGSQAAGGRQPP
jgi:IS30 family transposase